MSYWDKEVELKEIVGKKIKNVTGLEKDSDEVRIFTECGNEYLFYHDQNCCESVTLNDFEISSKSIIGGLVVSAEATSKDNEGDLPVYPDSWTWTFYKIETDKGGLWMRWLGESNGYYSEEVNFAWINKPSVN